MNKPALNLPKGRKVDQVLKGAREIFMRDGFERASVDDIAKAANVSKATLYSYFPDKRTLFQEVITTECKQLSQGIIDQINPDNSARDQLLFAATQSIRFIVSDFAQKMFRICLAESDRFPELGQAYYESGPGNGHCELVNHLSAAVECGELKIDDVDMAAWQFTELLKSKVFVRAAFGVQSEFSDAELDNVAEEAVETFMARYGS